MATQKFKRLKSSGWFKIEIACMDCDSFEKLAKDHNGVKFFLGCQEIFDGTVDANGKQTKDSNETVRVFSTMITKKKPSMKL